MAENNNTYQHDSICEVDCDEYVKTSCVIFQEELPYLGLEAGASTTEVINKLVLTVEFLQQQINDLKALHL